MDQLTICKSLSESEFREWNELAGQQPFVRYEYLSALHEIGCASKRTGWDPVYIVLRRDGTLAGVMPLYLKAHSRGEYVFDYAWAEAFERNGIQYYPKLLSAIPFTPVTGSRLIARTLEDRLTLARAAIQLASDSGISSLHVLFASESDIEALRECGFMLREGIQFHWTNVGYPTYDAFLECLTREKRKKLRQDRRRVADAGISFRWLRGAEIDHETLRFFYRCYVTTYKNHGSAPYLSLEFFQRLATTMPSALLLVLALRHDEPVASALNMLGGNVLYGRYWGATEFVSGLHFETCYCQAIEYCIQNKIDSFEGGAQGGHKLARGMLPTATWSAHWISNPDFASAISQFLRQETQFIEEHLEEMEAHTPFRS